MGLAPGGGGRLCLNFTRMCVSKSEGHGSFMGIKCGTSINMGQELQQGPTIKM